MKKFIQLLAVVYLLSALPAYAQIENDWVGKLTVSGMSFDLVLHIVQSGDEIQTRMDIPKQSVSGLRAEHSSYEDGLYRGEWRSAGILIEGRIDEEGVLQANFVQGTFNIPISFFAEKDHSKLPRLKRQQDPKPKFNYDIEEVTFFNATDSVRLAGTLTSPRDVDNPPVVILVSGSGQQNRDSEIHGHKSFWVIADYFANKGIAVLRYDDRGIGESEAGTNLMAATTLDFARDAEAAVFFLKEKGYKHIGIAGHSEGGMIGPMVAARNRDVGFIILLAAPGVAGDSLLPMQTYRGSIAMGVDESVARYNAQFTAELARYAKNYTGQNLSQALSNKLRIMLDEDSLTAGMSAEEKEQIIQSNAQLMSAPWLVQFLKINPADYLKMVKCPVLVLHGSKDVQVPLEENVGAIEQALKQGKNKKVKVHCLEGLNHLFQPAGTGATSEYAQIEITIDPQVLELMATWINSLKLK